MTAAHANSAHGSQKQRINHPKSDEYSAVRIVGRLNDEAAEMQDD